MECSPGQRSLPLAVVSNKASPLDAQTSIGALLSAISRIDFQARIQLGTLPSGRDDSVKGLG